MCSWKWLTVSQYKLSKRTNTKNMLYSFENCSLTHFANIISNCIVTEPLRQFSTVGEFPRESPSKCPIKHWAWVTTTARSLFRSKGQRTQRIEGGRGVGNDGKRVSEGHVKHAWAKLATNHQVSWTLTINTVSWSVCGHIGMPKREPIYTYTNAWR